MSSSIKERPIILSTPMIKAILDGKKTQTRRVVMPQPIKRGNLWEWGISKGKGVSIPLCLGVDGKQVTECILKYCPHGQIGDRLWVRETHYRYGRWVKNGLTKSGKQAWKFFSTTDEVRFYDDAPSKLYPHKTREEIARERLSDWCKRPSIFLPFRDSRLTLEITGLRVERLQEISEEDAKVEGANPFLLDKLKGGTKYKMQKTYHHECYPLVSHADEGEEVVFECPNMGFARLHHTQWLEGQDPIFRIPAQEVFEYVGALEPDYKNGFRILWDSLNAKRGYGWDKNPWCWVIKFDNIGIKVK